MSNTAKRNPPAGRGFMMGGGPPAMRGGEKPKDFKKSLKTTFAYLKEFRLLLVIVMFIAASSATLGILSPKVMVGATDQLAVGVKNTLMGLESGIDLNMIGRTLLILASLYIVSALLSYIQGLIMSGITSKVSYRLRSDMLSKINRLPIVYFNRTTHGDILSRITNDIDSLTNSLNHSLTQIISSVTTLVGVLIMMLSISWNMTLIAILILPVTSVLVMLIVRVSQRYFRGTQENLGTVNGYIEEAYDAHLTIKAYNGESRAINEFNEVNEQLYLSAWKSQFLSGLMQPIMGFVGNLSYVVVCLVGAIMATNG
ncbi:MAG: ABC transporter ATP-binding protein, partial [Oscillospiraceae bacterium]|nr:ABC transporter ATP-binding protein [Oscillospiraceae bacterium]